MAAKFAGQLHAELAVIQAELERLEARRRLVVELLELESNAAASPTPVPARTAAPRRAGTAKRRRLQRMQEAGEIENVGRNRWRLREAAGRAGSAAPPAPSRTPPVVSSTTILGSRPSARG